MTNHVGKREAKSYLSNPIRLDKFPDIPANYIDELDAVGIRNSRQLFNGAKEMEDRQQLSHTTEIPLESLTELVCLSDLSRIYGVGPMDANLGRNEQF